LPPLVASLGCDSRHLIPLILDHRDIDDEIVCELPGHQFALFPRRDEWRGQYPLVALGRSIKLVCAPTLRVLPGEGILPHLMRERITERAVIVCMSCPLRSYALNSGKNSSPVRPHVEATALSAVIFCGPPTVCPAFMGRSSG